MLPGEVAPCPQGVGKAMQVWAQPARSPLRVQTECAMQSGGRDQGIPLPLMPGNPCVFAGERGVRQWRPREVVFLCRARLVSGAFCVLEGLPFPLEPAEATAPSPCPPTSCTVGPLPGAAI